jgi:hypothetical protein
LPVGGDGKYRFTGISDDGAPITFSPCRPIRYVIRPDNQPKGGSALIRSAISDLSAATGLVFVDDGTTTEPISSQREPYQPERYGERWAPVLIAWATPQEVPEFDIDVVGQAGPQGVSRSDGTGAYVTGEVYLDPDGLTELRESDGKRVAKAVILHELGHLVGLAHVADRTQLMHPETSADITTYQAGDLTGLAKLGTGPCQPDL